MARPTVGEVAEIVYEDLAGNAFGDEDLDWPLLFFVGCIGGIFQDAWDIAQDTDGHAGWEHVLSPTDTPSIALKYLSNYVGVTVQPAWTEEETRDALRNPAAFRRGSVPHIRSVVQRFLTGTKNVQIREREGGAWNLEIRTMDNESPDGGSVDGDALIIAALIAETKPVGIILDFESVPGIDYTGLDADFTDYDDLAAEDLTYDEVALLPI